MAEEKDKMMKGVGKENPKPAEDSQEREYHFAGSGKYKPMVIRAKSRADAEKQWADKRIEVEN